MRAIVLDTRQAAIYLNISVSRIRDLARKQEIPHHRMAGRLFFLEIDLRRWRRRQRHAPADHQHHQGWWSAVAQFTLRIMPDLLHLALRLIHVK
jgi:excisionase family DNA binding protein